MEAHVRICGCNDAPDDLCRSCLLAARPKDEGNSKWVLIIKLDTPIVVTDRTAELGSIATLTFSWAEQPISLDHYERQDIRPDTPFAGSRPGRPAHLGTNGLRAVQVG